MPETKRTKFHDLFSVKKPIIGMIHLAGDTPGEKIDRAREELVIFERYGVSGVIIEDYHTRSMLDVCNALEELSGKRKTVQLGVNLLQDPKLSFELAREFGATFVQLDDIQGPEDIYAECRENHPDIVILGGVRFKYTPSTGDSLEKDLEQGMQRCDAIVTTGSGTGIETPLEKLIRFRKYIGDFPLIAGAGVTSENVYEQLLIANGAIIGSGIKYGNNTQERVDSRRVSKLMKVVRKLRTDNA